MSAQTSSKPSEWQQRIEGVWYGRPSIFDSDGNHVGYNKVHRSSVFENGQTTYYMDTILLATGPLRYRLESRDFAFGVIDSDQNRIYLGPDFIGAGRPFGALVDAHYYSPQWTSDLRTMVHILQDNETQVYSSLLYDGPTIHAVFNGVYKVAFDYDSSPTTREKIDRFVESEIENGQKPHVLPAKKSGQWTGELEVFDNNQQKLGASCVQIEYRPLDLLRGEMHVEISGVLNKQYRFARTRNQNRHTFDGPDVYGNGIAYGRALYTSQHFHGESFKIKGREFIIDDQYTMSVVWQFIESDKQTHVAFGVLKWEEKSH